MSRPPLEVADLVRTAGSAFIERNRAWIRWTHIKVLLAIAHCRTAALGGHIDECVRCGHRDSYNSCRNRHCPKCQTGARERWIQARRRDSGLVSSSSMSCSLYRRNWRHWLFRTKRSSMVCYFGPAQKLLLEVARNPRHLGAEIGFFSVLHAWNQKLQLHPHVHCVVPAGGLSLDHTRWIRSRPRFFLPIAVLRRVFRGKFVAGLKSAFEHGRCTSPAIWLCLRNPRSSLPGSDHCSEKTGSSTPKPPFRRPRVCPPVPGLVHPSRRHLQPSTGLVGRRPVYLRWRDSAHNNEQKLMTVSLDEFLRRFLLHLLPKGFVGFRNFVFLANHRRSTLLPLCFAALGTVPIADQTRNLSHAGIGPSLALPPVWRTHGGHRTTYRCSTPTPFSTSVGHYCRMKRLTHNSKTLHGSPRSTPVRPASPDPYFAPSVTPSSIIDSRGLTFAGLLLRFRAHSRQLQHLSLALFNLHMARVRRANGFLLTAFSNARPIFCSAPLGSLRARLRKSTSVTRSQSAASVNAWSSRVQKSMIMCGYDSPIVTDADGPSF